MSLQNICSMSQTDKTMLCRGPSQARYQAWAVSNEVPSAMGVHGLSKLHIVPAGETINANNYVTNILRKELKPALKRQKNSGWIDERKLVQCPGHETFFQNGATPHTALVTQEWCTDNSPNFISKDEWPGNSPDLNCIEKNEVPLLLNMAPVYIFFEKFCIFWRKLQNIFCIVCTFMLRNLHRTNIPH